jgi:hypothetical protein
MIPQSATEACHRFVTWLDRQVTLEGRGDNLERLDVDPASTFWLGRLASEDHVLASQLGDRAERLDPCAIGIRVRPEGEGPWTFTVRAEARAWIKDPRGTSHPEGPWRHSGLASEEIVLTVASGTHPELPGNEVLTDQFVHMGADGLRAEVRVDRELREGAVELVIQLVNTSPDEHPRLSDTHIYETRLQIRDLPTVPFQLEALPDSFRYDRLVPAFGINVAVTATDDPVPTFTTTDTSTVDTLRPGYWNSDRPQPVLSFDALADEPIGPLTDLVEALSEWNSANWSDTVRNQRANEERWTDQMREEFDRARDEVLAEQARLKCGLDLLCHDPAVGQSFRLMNRAIAYSSEGRGYDSWRPFQIGFLLGALPFLTDRDTESSIVDTVWFATGGGKTETYLGLLVTNAFHDRITGKTTGVTAWSRFPLRLLSLQQTQRFADALAGAERVRREEDIKGAPFSLGFLVGKGGTPNRILKDATDDHPDPESPGMPDKYQVLLRCPFCHGDRIEMRFDRRYWRLGHQCLNDECSWPERYLPFYVVDEEIYRFLPTVVLGTLDKAASIGLQAAMRGLFGPPLGLCSAELHGYTYAERSARPNGCLVPDCTSNKQPLPMARDRFAPSLRLQDELHLLRDSLGAVDSHYESLLDHLQESLGAKAAKVVASSATLNGHDRQVEILYRRTGRVFPLQGPTATNSFWTTRTPYALRRFVAVAPRGVTLEHVSDRTLNVLQKSVRKLVDNPTDTCADAGIDPMHAELLLNLYGTDVVYGNTLQEVEATERSLATNTDIPVNAVQLTGQTDFDDVREILDRLEEPEQAFVDRIHVVAASSMLSHGVDVSRLNVMVMLGLPLGSAEFIQTSARVGRRYPGLVYVLHKIARERDAQTFRQFSHYVTHGDRFVEPVPITRRSRRVLRLTMPGIVEARRLAIMEPTSATGRLTTLRLLKDFVSDGGLTSADQTDVVAALLGFTGDDGGLLRDEIRLWLDSWFANLQDPATTARWPSDLSVDRPMISLRDVESRAPIRD